MTRLQSRRCILDHQTPLRRDAQLRSASEVWIGVRFASGDVVGGDEPCRREGDAALGERAGRIDVRCGGDNRPSVPL